MIVKIFKGFLKLFLTIRKNVKVYSSTFYGIQKLMQIHSEF